MQITVSFGMKRGQRIFVDFLHDTSSNFDFKTDTALYVTIQYIQTVVSKCTPKSKWVKYEILSYPVQNLRLTKLFTQLLHTYIHTPSRNLCNAHFYTTLYNQFPQPSNYQIYQSSEIYSSELKQVEMIYNNVM